MSDRLNKIISIIIAVVFMSNSLGYAEPLVNPQPIVYSPQSINIPEAYGRVEKCQISKSPKVILIKDAHCHYEAQRNIAKILDILIVDYKIDLICIEGASGRVNPSIIAGSPDKKRREEVADRYLKKGWLTASEVLAMEKGRDYGFSIWGVEDLNLYLNDLIAFRDVYKDSGDAERFIGLAEDLVSGLKNRLYPPDLHEYDEMIVSYRKNAISLSKLIKYLYDIDKDSFSRFKNLNHVLQSLILEKAVDFNKVENERLGLIRDIEKRSPKEEIQELVRNSLLYKLGKITQDSYYSYLRRFISLEDLTKYANLYRYIKVVKLHSRIDEDGMFNELNALIEKIYGNYIDNEIAKKLFKIDKYIYHLGRLLKLEITRDEIMEYKKSGLNPSSIVEFLKVQGTLNNINIPYEFSDNDFIAKADECLKNPLEFYRYAIERDNVLIENLVSKMKEEGKDKAVLIIGGFHADGASRLLREKGIHVITITPSITKEDAEAKRIYLSRMMDERIQPEEILNESNNQNLAAGVLSAEVWRTGYADVIGRIQNESLRGILKRAETPEGAARELEEFKGELDEADRRVVEEFITRISETPGAATAVSILRRLIGRESVPKDTQTGPPAEMKETRSADTRSGGIIQGLWEQSRVLYRRMIKRLQKAAWEPSRLEGVEVVKDSQEAFSYSDPRQDFRGVSLEHFIWAINRLAVMKQPVLGVGLSREDIDIINNGTYQDPRVAIEIIGQNPNPQAQGVYEAVANGLDALGFNIGQFGKGVKQIISWLGATGIDRIDVYTRKENGLAYQLTILKDKNGQNYIQIRKIRVEDLPEGFVKGTVLKVTTAGRIPRTEEELDEKHRNSQEGIRDGIHKRFPYIRAIKITTQIGEEEPEEVNGFKEKVDIVPAQVTTEMPRDREDRRIHIALTDHTITVFDNGIGMDAETISRMFIPKHGTKHPEPLRGERAQEELKKVKVVHDSSLPHRVSFSRNGEVIRAVDVPRSLMNDATVSGGLQVELAGLMDVPESRDNIIISPDLKAGETTNFQKAVLFAIGEIIKHPGLSNAEKLGYINTIAVGLNGLVQGNDEIAYVVNAIYVSIQESTKPIIEGLWQEGFIILPHDKQFGQLAIPFGKKVIFISERLFNWRGAVSLREIGGRIVPWVTLGGKERLPLVVISFKPGSVKNILGFNVDWHRLREDERVPIIRTDRFIAIPKELGDRLYELAGKRVVGLSDEEEKEFNSLLERLNIITSSEVVTSYELTKPRENMVVVPRGEIRIATGKVDSEVINGFLTEESITRRISAGQIGSIPSDANQRYTLLENGEVIEIGTGNKVVFCDVEQLEYLTNGFYKITWKQGEISVERFVDGNCERLFLLDKRSADLTISPDKRFVFVKKKNERHVGYVFDLEKEEKRSLPDAFIVKERGIISNNQTYDLRFSKNCKYLTYMEDTIHGFGGKYLVAVDLWTREIVKRVQVYDGVSITTPSWHLGGVYIEYEINPYADVVYVKRYINGEDELLLIDLDDGEMGKCVAGRAWHKLYTDSTGAYTVLVDHKGEQSIYIHKTKRILRARNFGGKKIDRVFTVFQRGEVFYGVKVDRRWCYFNERGDIINRVIEADKLICIEDFQQGIAGFHREGYVLVPLTEIDPLQRLDRGVYHHPQFNLIINKTTPDKPIAIDPIARAELQYEGEIVAFVSGKFLLSRLGDQISYYTYRQAERIYEPTTTLKGIVDSVPASYEVVYMLDDKYTFMSTIGSYDMLHPYPLISTREYTSVIFDGRYFVFTNPKTGDVAYVDPKSLDKPIFVPAKGEIVQDLSPDGRSLIDRILGMRDSFIKQAQDSYRPFLVLIPEEYRSEIEGMLKVYIARLYNEQEKAVIAKFKDASEAVLPFSRFSRNMEQIMQHLSSFINSARVRSLLMQEGHDMQKTLYMNIFGKLFELCLEMDLATADFDMDILFKVMMYCWNPDSQEMIGLIPVIARFVTGLEDAVGITVKILAIGKILVTLSSAVTQSPHEKSRILRMQIEKILNSESRKQVLVKMYQAFAKIDEDAIDRYESDPSCLDELGDARMFVIFLTNDVEQVVEKERFIPNGEDIEVPGDGVELSQIIQLEQQRKKKDREDVVMDIDYLIGNLSNLPERSSALETDILQNVTVQRESGAYTAEITQNSSDATKGMAGELVVDFYIQGDVRGEKEYVEEAADNGTGALKEVALLIPRSTKAGGGQVALTGFFGTGKYTIFEGVDRVEIITKNDKSAYMFTFTVIRDNGKPIAVKLIGIRRIDDERVKQGVTVRRIKALRNTIPELDQMLAQRSWKTFAGLAQHDGFKIYFIDPKGDKHPLTVDKEVLSEVEFKAVKPEDKKETSFGKLRIISIKDMPLQIVDRIGLRVCEIKEEYLALIPHSLRRYLKELGIIVQIPLPLIRNRSGFENENYYLPVIQRYVAIAFYKAIAYKALTQTSPQFVFDGLPLDWETNDDYWHSIDPSGDKNIIEMAKKINSGRYNEINNTDLEVLLVGEGRLDKKKSALKLILQLEAEVKGKPISLAGRRLAIQLKINRERAEAQREILGIPEDRIPEAGEDLLYSEKVAQAKEIELGHEQMRNPERYVVPPEEYTAKEDELVNLTLIIARNFGLEKVVLLNEDAAFAGAFKGNTMYLSRSLAEKIGRADRGNGFIDEATNTIVHELSHYLEHLMRLGKTGLSSDEIYIAELANFTHDSVGTFAEAMKYVAAVSVAARQGDLTLVLEQRLQDLLKILMEDGRLTEDELEAIVAGARQAAREGGIGIVQEITAIKLAIEELKKNKVPGFINGLIKALGGDEEIIRGLVMELYNYNGYDDYFVLMLKGIRTMFGIEEGTDADKYLKMLDRYVMVKSRFKADNYKIGTETFSLPRLAEIIARYLTDSNELLNLFKDETKRKQVKEGIDLLIKRKGLAGQIEPEKYLSAPADLDLVRPIVVDARYLLIQKKDGGYTISAMAEQLKWLLLRAGNNLMILYDGAEGGKNVISEWLGVGRFITEAEYPTDEEGVVAMLTHGTASRLKNKSGNHRVVKGKLDGEDDLMLMGHIAGILGSVEVLSEESIGNPLRELYKAYYKGDKTEMVEDMLDEIIRSIQKGISLVIELPPIAPFVKPYYNALKQAMEMTASSA